jgi:hypothetical protein
MRGDRWCRRLGKRRGDTGTRGNIAGRIGRGLGKGPATRLALGHPRRRRPAITVARRLPTEGDRLRHPPFQVVVGRLSAGEHIVGVLDALAQTVIGVIIDQLRRRGGGRIAQVRAAGAPGVLDADQAVVGVVAVGGHRPHGVGLGDGIAEDVVAGLDLAAVGIIPHRRQGGRTVMVLR